MASSLTLPVSGPFEVGWQKLVDLTVVEGVDRRIAVHFAGTEERPVGPHGRNLLIDGLVSSTHLKRSQQADDIDGRGVGR